MKKSLLLILISTLLLFLFVGRIKIASLYHNRGVDFFNKGDYKKAEQNFVLALKFYSRSFQTHYELAKTYSMLGSHQLAIDEFRMALKINPRPEVFTNLALEYLMVRNFKSAFDVIKKGRQMYPQDKGISSATTMVRFSYALYLSHQAEKALKDKDYKKAIDYYEQALKIFPHLPNSTINLVSLYRLIGKSDEAQKLLNDYITSNPRDFLAHKILGDIYLELSHYTQAIEEYKVSIKYKPDYAPAYNQLALAYDYLGFYASALDAVKKAHALQPENNYILYNLGKIYRDNRMFQQALEAFSTLYRRNPDFPFIQEALAEVYILIGDKNKAGKVLSQEIDTTYKEYRLKKDRNLLLKLVYLNFLKKDYAEVKRLINQAVSEGRDFPELHYFAGRVWEDEGQLLKAVQEFEKAISGKYHRQAQEKIYQIISY
ncbi:MAG TPA: tetratricopeptide repeat protein [Candidatus Omnitrophica bacterium]|nr:tetratricopeptide repeat protein [Candidatus Omnitrophota bacterium]